MEKKIFNGDKIKTGIIGLDKLLFGGLYLQSPNPGVVEHPLEIAIYGVKGTSKALLAMQLLHGITISLNHFQFFTKDNKDIKFLPPLYYTNKYKQNVSDMLLDMLLSKCINDIVENNAKGKQDWIGSKFANFVFNTEKTTYPIATNKLDYYIGEEILVYDTHTNALHFARPLNQRHRAPSDNLPLFTRRYDDIKKYADKSPELNCGNKEEEKVIVQNFFDIRICSEKDGEFKQSDDKAYYDKQININKEGRLPCIVIDDLTKKQIDNITYLKEKSFVTIYLIEGTPKKIKRSFDMVIELSKREDEPTHYLFNQLSIKKSTMQDTAIGWHIYKKRDYGIEVYPSTHVILQKRRHMPKDLLLSQKSILSENFQKFIDAKDSNDGVNDLNDFEKNPISEGKKLFKMLDDVDASRQKEYSVDILKRILIPKKSTNNQGESTALIGPPNTYKRFLTHSGTFNACCEGKNTLYILLDKDDQIMDRNMLCPAYICKKAGKNSSELRDNCSNCYKHIHSSNIRMGCISSDEFFYYLIRQIDLSRASKSNKISRIVIDDLQKIEYCFPIIQKDSLFLTTLISICKDYEINLFMLCDKSSPLVGALRAQADNVICTERTSEDSLNIYIERYAGYSTPSRIWKCEVDDMLKLFYCDATNSERQFYINERHIHSKGEFTMNHYWQVK